MTNDEMVVDVSQDWAAACDVQQGFMKGLGRAVDTVDYGEGAARFDLLETIATISCRSLRVAWRCSLDTPPAKAFPRHSW